MWNCNYCGRIDSESHILFCEQFKDLRNEKDLENYKDLATYLYKVNLIRQREETRADSKLKARRLRICFLNSFIVVPWWTVGESRTEVTV